MNSRSINVIGGHSLSTAALLIGCSAATKDGPPKIPMKKIASIDPAAVEQARSLLEALSDTGTPIIMEISDEGDLLIDASYSGTAVFSMKNNDRLAPFPPLAPPIGLVQAHNEPAYPDTTAWASLLSPKSMPIYNFNSADIDFMPPVVSRPSSKRGARAAAKRRFGRE